MLGTLSLLAVLAAPKTIAPIQPLNATGTKVKQAFANLDKSWNMGVSGRPKLLSTRWSLFGGIVSGQKGGLGWNVTMKAGETLSYTISADNSVKSVGITILDSAKKQLLRADSGQTSTLSHSFTAPANGSYSFGFGSPSLGSGQGYILVAFDDANGHTVTSNALTDFGDAVSIIYNEATSGADALTVEPNRVTLYGAVFPKSYTRVISGTSFTNGVYALFAAAEDDRQTLKFSVTNDKKEVIAQDDETQPFAMCMISQETPSATISFTNGSSKPRLGFVARFKAK